MRVTRYSTAVNAFYNKVPNQGYYQYQFTPNFDVIKGVRVGKPKPKDQIIKTKYVKCNLAVLLVRFLKHVEPYLSTKELRNFVGELAY